MDTSLIAFVVAALVVLIAPGPGVLYVVARSMSQGRQAGLVSAAGLSTGALVHVLAATVGLGALLAASATAYGVVKLTDGAYALLTSRLRERFGARFGRSRWPNYASGTVYIGLGVTTALADRR